jgi:phage baseplate assembly protein V
VIDEERIFREVRRIVMGMLAQAGTHRRGTVTSVDPAGTYAVKVLFQPEGVASGWLPLKAHAIGSGWGIVALPNIGDQVLIAAPENDISQGVVIGAVYSDTQRAPPSQAGEYMLVHQNGSFLKITNDGKVSINGDVEIDMTAPALEITTTGAVNVTAGGAVTITGSSINLN